MSKWTNSFETSSSTPSHTAPEEKCEKLLSKSDLKQILDGALPDIPTVISSLITEFAIPLVIGSLNTRTIYRLSCQRMKTFHDMVSSQFEIATSSSITPRFLQNVHAFVSILDHDLTNAEKIALYNWVVNGGVLIVGVVWMRETSQNEFLQHFGQSVTMYGGITVSCRDRGPLFRDVDEVYMYGSANISVGKTNATVLLEDTERKYITAQKVGDGTIMVLPFALLANVTSRDNHKFLENLVSSEYVAQTR